MRLTREEVPADLMGFFEPDPGCGDCYVCHMVAVFREVRRVLRDDGTVWLNLGSSYLSSAGERTYGSYDGVTGRGPGTRRNRAGVGASGRSPFPLPERALAYGSDGTGPQGSSGPGSAYHGLCDGCRAALSSRSPDTLRPLPEDASLLDGISRGSEPPGSGPASLDASPLDALASTTPLSETRPLAACAHCEGCSACLSVLGSSTRDARLCARRTDDTNGTAQRWPTSDAHIGDTGPSGLAWGDYTSTLKPKDLVPIPWMVAMALQADGWYLRRDVIWAKPNPIPESVTDRPTSAHEYVFLLSKRERYYFDADAVRETTGREASWDEYNGADSHYMPSGTLTEGVNAGFGAKHDSLTHPLGRNIRSVWTIATQPYPGAHFATFPEALVVPCIKAGCPEGGVVLDPFSGSGTVGRVAERLSRRSILIELNPDYVTLAEERTAQIGLGLTG